MQRIWETKQEGKIDIIADTTETWGNKTHKWNEKFEGEKTFKKRGGLTLYVKEAAHLLGSNNLSMNIQQHLF